MTTRLKTFDEARRELAGLDGEKVDRIAKIREVAKEARRIVFADITKRARNLRAYIKVAPKADSPIDDDCDGLADKK